MSPFQSLYEYEEYIYTLQQRFPSIVMSTLAVVRRGAQQARVAGELTFGKGHKLIIRERLTAEDGALLLERYSYEAWCNAEILYWYDSQAHPDNPDLAATHPHHKHVPPDIKHNRILAPGFSFMQPNLPLLIAEIEQLIQ